MNKQQLFQTAWMIAKKGAAKFGGSSKEYFALSLKIAYTLQGGITVTKKHKTFTLELSGNKKFKPWAAKITGEDEKFGLKREFLNADEQDGNNKEYWLFDGVYEYTEGRRTFIVVKDGEATQIEKEDVINYI